MSVVKIFCTTATVNNRASAINFSSVHRYFLTSKMTHSQKYVRHFSQDINNSNGNDGGASGNNVKQNINNNEQGSSSRQCQQDPSSLFLRKHFDITDKGMIDDDYIHQMTYECLHG